MKVDSLWEVKPKSVIQEGSALLIIAKNLDTATSKAKRWLKKRKYSSFIRSVELVGFIDVF